MNVIWQTILIFAVGTLFLRLSGRKTISQMTMPETMIMIAFGTLIIQPVTGHGIWRTFGVGAILILALLVTEYIQLKSDRMETFISGQSIIVIENGILNENNLKKLRLTVDKLEARFRQAGISSIKDIQYATIEVSGQLGYTLKKEKQPATKEDIQNLIQLIQSGQLKPIANQTTQPNIFSEVAQNKSTTKHPDYLQ